ncbi:MAG: hypothetical protein IPF99_11400 [Deltaproteobacteria bacterium]|nr:hypothetical protein [Deltaproteobacteria bacterium]
MHVGFNELSLHGQVPLADAPKILAMMLECREMVRRFGGALRLRREVLSRPLGGTITLLDFIQRIPSQDSRKRLLLSWLTKEGPFLEDSREHLPDTLYECLGVVVTDWTLAELAHRHGISGGASISAVSLHPSNMDTNPLEVIRRYDEDSAVAVAVHNHTDARALGSWLAAIERPMQSWKDLVLRARRECSSLYFSNDAFDSLESQSFFPGAASSLLDVLTVLERLKRSIGPDGARSAEGQEIYQNHIMRQLACSTDSSEGEKSKFRDQLTFAHPERHGEKLFCPWHGKVQTPQMRVHYSDPITYDEPLYIVYVGPKLTK